MSDREDFPIFDWSSIRPTAAMLPPETFLTRTDAEAKAQRAFWRGVFIGAVVVLIIGSIAAVLT